MSAEAAAPEVLLEKDARGVARITLNRPAARNALSRAVNETLRRIAGELAADSTLRAVVITGAGDQAFCAGADLKERRGVTAAQTGPFIDAIAGAIDAIAALRVPTIAAMNGAAYGGGLELALACDFRVMVEGAEVGLTEVRLGIMPGAGGTQRLPRIVGEAHAKELILLGRRISASRAHAIGLATSVVPASQLAAAVDELLTDLTACAPLSLRQAKTAIEDGASGSLADGLRLERRCYEVTLFSRDRDEGLAAFAERRPPRFSGS
jgi:methylglutaconyl-CoA hydratase